MIHSIIPVIDYRKIADAKDYYEQFGFGEISVPWIVGHQAYLSTRPPLAFNRREFYTLDGYLNASGEQGFIELMLNGYVLNKHCCVTACYRDEVPDELHHSYFVKLELIDTEATEVNMFRMIGLAEHFFNRYFSSHPVRIIETQDSEVSYDIVDGIDGIELGSYGIRHYKDLRWIYGTGLALPRLDTILAMRGLLSSS